MNSRIIDWLKKRSLILDALVITGIAFGLSYFVQYDLTSISAFAPMKKATDFRLTDVYNAVADRRAERALSDDVIIVSIDGCSRESIAEVLDFVDYLNPAAIGLDVFFSHSSGTDEDLLSSLSQCSRLVFPVGLQLVDGHPEVLGSYFYDEIYIEHKGVVNLSANSVRNVIRDFETEFMVGNDTLRSFATELARIAAPDKYAALMSRGQDKVVINYPSWEFDIISTAELLDGGISIDEAREIMEGKVVLVGNVYDPSDFHLTPIDADMAGLLIHARALQTILDSCYVGETANTWSWAIAMVLSFAFVLLVLRLKRGVVFSGCLIRILQVFSIYLFLVIGCNMFIHSGEYINFAPTLLMFGLGLLAMDIWLGAVEVVRRIMNKKMIRNQVNKNQ